MAKPPISLVPSPEQLRQFKELDPSYPSLVFQARDKELHRQFVYASIALVIAGVALVVVLGGFVYLVMQGHPTEAKILLGAGVLGLVASFIRARLASLT